MIFDPAGEYSMCTNYKNNACCKSSSVKSWDEVSFLIALNDKRINTNANTISFFILL